MILGRLVALFVLFEPNNCLVLDIYILYFVFSGTIPSQVMRLGTLF